jgi:hypothetical protein
MKKVLCQSQCCPVVMFGKDGVIIKDDYEGSVKLTHEDMDSLIESYLDYKIDKNIDEIKEVKKTK